MDTTEVMRTTNCMDPRLLSGDTSSLSISRRSSGISTSLLLQASSSFRRLSPQNSPGADVEHPAKVRYKFPAPIDQFFKGAELGKWLMTLDGGALVALMGFHQDSALLSKKHVGPMVVLLMLGFCALFAGLLFQESCSEFAVVAVLFGAASVVATFLTMITAILAPLNLDLVVWAVVGPMAALLAVLLWVIANKGMREKVVVDDSDLCSRVISGSLSGLLISITFYWNPLFFV
ncbi:hypothetical protein V2J09_015303 [Rumex salicifolius]